MITVATSIVPRNIEVQQSAINSWLNLGFAVVSINTYAEIDFLNKYFPDLFFVPAGRTAEKITGRPYIYFDDVCNALAASNSDICGIINSDIHLRAQEDFSVFVSREARGSFLFGSRIDVKATEECVGDIYYSGFDYFFFDKGVIAVYPDSELCLGLPWWDYWAIIVPWPVRSLARNVSHQLLFTLNMKLNGIVTNMLNKGMISPLKY